jgi:hypothetical protein
MSITSYLEIFHPVACSLYVVCLLASEWQLGLFCDCAVLCSGYGKEMKVLTPEYEA